MSCCHQYPMSPSPPLAHVGFVHPCVPSLHRTQPHLGHQCGLTGISGGCLAHAPSIGLVSPGGCGESEEGWAVLDG